MSVSLSQWDAICAEIADPTKEFVINTLMGYMYITGHQPPTKKQVEEILLDSWQEHLYEKLSVQPKRCVYDPYVELIKKWLGLSGLKDARWNMNKVWEGEYREVATYDGKLHYPFSCAKLLKPQPFKFDIPSLEPVPYSLSVYSNITRAILKLPALTTMEILYLKSLNRVYITARQNGKTSFIERFIKRFAEVLGV